MAEKTWPRKDMAEKTWPTCASHDAQRTSVRRMNRERSSRGEISRPGDLICISQKTRIDVQGLCRVNMRALLAFAEEQE
jgi:hypothetical protein